MARNFVPIPIDTMAKAGDLARLPAGVSKELVNVLHRPGPRVEKRPAWASDMSGLSVTAGAGLMKWRDPVNNVDRLILDNGTIYVKDAVSEAWGAGVAGPVAGVVDSANFHDVLYWMSLQTGSGQYSYPNHYSFDGTNIDLDPFREQLSGRSIVRWKDRLWMFNISQSVLNRMIATDGTAYGYGPTWQFVNISQRNYLVAGGTMTQWTPTVVGAQAFGPLYNVPASSEWTYLSLRADLQGVASLYRMPMTLGIYIAVQVNRLQAYQVGAIANMSNVRYRCVVAGTTAAGAPAYPASPVGTTVVDGGATWQLEDTTPMMQSIEIEVDAATDNNGTWQTEGLTAAIPPLPNTTTFAVTYNFGTTARPTYELHPVNVGFQDVYVDGDVRKKNRGQQLTVARFFYEFFNRQSSNTAAIVRMPNRIICCEPGDAKQWRSDLFWDMTEGTGDGVVIRPLRDLMCAYKRNAISTYQVVEGTAAATLPMRYVQTFSGVGCIHPRAIATAFESLHFFVGENGVYQFDGASAPDEISTDAMREAIFDATNLVNPQSDGYVGPVVAVDEKNREVRVMTQAGKLWVYSLDSKKWSSENITSGNGTTAPSITHFTYYRNRFYALPVSGTTWVAREDPTVTQDQVGIAATPFNVTAEVWLHPFETITRDDQLVEEIVIQHDISGDQTGSTLEAAISRDRGLTFPQNLTVTIPITTDRQPIRIPVWQGGANLVVRLRHTGKCGPSYFNLFWAGAWVQELGAELNDAPPATVSASL